MALTKAGFKRRTYQDILEDMSERARVEYGRDANVSEKSVLGIILRINSWFLSLLWQDVEDVYHSGYRKTAEGAQLDMLLPYAGVTRRLAERAQAVVQFTGEPGQTIASGFQVSTAKGISFFTIENIELNNEGVGYSRVVAVEAGSSGNVGNFAINTIVNPTLGITSVRQLEAATGGLDIETDAEVKKRANLTIEGLGSGTTASIRAALLKTTGVRGALIIENHSEQTDSFGTPRRSIQAFVLGGNDEDIATAIMSRKAAGVRAFGTTAVTIQDISSNDQVIGFTRAHEINFKVRIHATTQSDFPYNGADQIRDNIIRYTGGTLSDNQMVSGLSMGDNLIHARILMYALGVEGVVDADVEISKDGTTWESGNFDIGIHEIVQIHAKDIEVTTSVQY